MRSPPRLVTRCPPKPRSSRDADVLTGWPVTVTLDTQPPVDDDEARFDDESSAVGRPEPVETAALEATSRSREEPASKHDGSFRSLIRAARWVRRCPRHGSSSGTHRRLPGSPQLPTRVRHVGSCDSVPNLCPAVAYFQAHTPGACASSGGTPARVTITGTLYGRRLEQPMTIGMLCEPSVALESAVGIILTAAVHGRPT